MNGFFITFEGTEGSGKSTQVGFLGSKLMEEGLQPVVVREPGGTRIGELIRNITHGKENVELTAVSEAYLMAASRAQLVRELIKPALDAGKIVVADRFLDSSLSYQGYGRELGEEVIEKLNNLAIENIKPDLTFFLNVSPEIGFKRRNHSTKIDRLDLQQKDFYDRVYRGYLKLAGDEKGRIIILDGMKSIKDLNQEIWTKVKDRLQSNINSEFKLR
jgi:dTMP kinase